MKAQLLVGSGQVIQEFDWPEDFDPKDIREGTLQALRNFYEVQGPVLAPRRNIPGAVPYEVRVLSDAGKLFHRCNLVDLAKSLGVEAPYKSP